MTRRILVIQHAGVMGGSVITLVQVAKLLRQSGYAVNVCLLNPSPEVVEYHAANDVPHFVNRRILAFPHTSGSWMHLGDLLNTYACVKSLIRWRRSVRETRRVVELHACDLVHLNSSILLPSAYALHTMGCRFVWHVRESPQPKYFGNRLRLFRRCLAEFPAERLFLSASDRLGWMGTHRLGEVIPHGVQDDWFTLSSEDACARQRLGIPPQAKCVLYLGGFMRIKGIFVLLRALHELVRQGVPVVCLMPGTERVRGKGWRSSLGRVILGLTQGGTEETQSLRMIETLRLRTHIRMMPFQQDLGDLFRAADMLVFPATVPHFAVPVVEAAAAGKAVIASDFAAMRELLEDQTTGVLVPPGDAGALADAMQTLLADNALRRQMGLAARARAREKCTFGAEVGALIQTYDRVLATE